MKRRTVFRFDDPYRASATASTPRNENVSIDPDRSAAVVVENTNPSSRTSQDFSRDGDTARRGGYTSRRRVANFPRRGFSIIPLAAFGLEEEKGGEREAKTARNEADGVLVETTASSPPLSSALEAGIPRQRVGPFQFRGSPW